MDHEAAAHLSRLKALDAATVHEAAGRVGHVAPTVRPIQRGVTLAGRAVTAEVHPGDNLALHRAVLAGSTGDVLVAAARGHLAGYWGEILAVAAQVRGIAGLVLDGGCRDTAALRARGFPVWSTGASVHGTVKRTPGTVNQNVVVGGVPVSPGDYVIADDDGVVVVPAGRIAEVLDAAEARVAREAEIMRQLRDGGTTIDLMGLAGALL
ncbi:MAG TPA: 4-carboxy-4-hydroxy-2-oxoadipate aldolase/oxaloacetate decarboxylase [Mycobacteriales bacterium]|nr:4-carboxy-4-hydroxy-2-oxoadipate aldolase/oxaloacetate decarboxylase [Mycobacteriales bacterium]